MVITFDHCQNSRVANQIVKRLLWGGAGGITLMPLFKAEGDLFARIKEEVSGILKEPGQEVDGSHPTTKYVAAQDPSWKPKTGGVRQYSLYNSRGDFLFNGDDHHWSDADRRFHPSLMAIPEFFGRHFQRSELQNCRLNSLTKEAGLGQHREKIIGIPGRTEDYKVRFHLPVITNPLVSFLMDGQEHKMKEGVVYLFNQSSMHGVTNAGEALRAHIVFDCYLDESIVEMISAIE